ncbi:MAG TPA: type I-A CRISPR-associated protein Cas5 [Archaeoglobus profundus]|nr:type I-A CRISPR-associated protein Cas5 [Archaeoglobus profundus]
MIGFIVDVEFVWGFQARVIGLSKTSPSFYYPPPTTFIGAMAEVIAKNEKFGEQRSLKLMNKLSENLLAIGLRPLNCKPIRYEDLNRIIMISKKMSKRLSKNILFPHPGDIPSSFDSPARGKTILASLDGDSPKLRWFIVFKNKSLDLNGKTIKIHEDIFWKIHRIGSKESVVSVVNVESFEPSIVQENIKTNYSFPYKDLKIVRGVGTWIYEVYINPFKFIDPVKDYLEGKNILPFKVPVLEMKDSEYYCIVKAKSAFKYEEEVVVGWPR